MKTALVIGATGAFGRAVLKRLRASARFRVVAASRHCEGPDSLQLDLCDRQQVAVAVKHTRPDWVLNLAGTFSNNLDEAYAVNVEGARHLLEAVQQSGSCIRVLLVGSAAEYGMVREEENPIREDHALNPVSIYGLTKAWQTQLAGYYATCGVDVVVARAFNLYGPRLSEQLFMGRLQKQIDDVLAERRSTIETGPLASIRDYISTDDAAEQMLAIAACAESGRVYHIASGQPVTMSAMLAEHLAAYRLDMTIVQTSAELSNRTGYDVPVIYADVTNTMKFMSQWRAGVEA